MIKTFLALIIFFLMVIIIQTIPIWISLHYFSNTSLDDFYLYRVNLDLQEFLLSIVLVFLFVGFYFYFRKTNKNFVYAPFIIMVSPLINIFNGIILIMNTKNLFIPELSTFKWKTWFDYTSYLHSWHSTILLFYLLVFIIVMII